MLLLWSLPYSKVSRDTLYEAVKEVLQGSQAKPRKYVHINAILCYSSLEYCKQHNNFGSVCRFVESVELQISLKNYDPQKDKRFSGTVRFDFLLFHPTFSLFASSPVWILKRLVICQVVAWIWKKRTGQEQTRRSTLGSLTELTSLGWCKRGRRTPTLGLKTWGKALGGWAGKFMSSSRSIKITWLQSSAGQGSRLW